MSNNTVYFVSLGCPRNLVDSEYMITLLHKNGYMLTNDSSNADYIIVNTCGFLEESRQEALAILEEMFLSKKPSCKIIAAGCMVQLFYQELRKKFPGIHFYLGSGDTDQVLQAIKKPLGKIITNKCSHLENAFMREDFITPPHYAYLKIAEGCCKSCSYCLIPQIKGPLKSKSIKQIETEFDDLLKKGVFEIILIAQDLTDFGKDRGKKYALEKLLKRLLQRKENFWLRLLYVYPDAISDELVAIMRSDPRICKYLDMPIQHINDDILRNMRRSVDQKNILHTIDRLKTAMPDIAIRTSLMVGFPQETEKQFAELLRFIKNYQLDQVGIFRFSSEKGTKAAVMEGQISQKVKNERYQRLAEAQTQVLKKLNAKQINRKIDALVDGYHPESNFLMIAHTQRQCPEIDNRIIINDVSKISHIGQKVKVQIQDVVDIDLLGAIS